MKVVAFLLIAILKDSMSYNLYPDSTWTVKEGDGFVTFLKPDERAGDIKSCELVSPFGKTWKLKSRNGEKHQSNDEHVKFLEEHICGAKVENVNDSFAGYWNVNVKNKNRGTQSFGFKLNVLKSNTFNITREFAGTPGHRVLLTCGEKYNENICEIKNLQTRQTEEVCKKVVFYPDSGITDRYLCLIKRQRSMDLALETISIRGKTNDELRNGYIFNTKESATLSCNFQELLSNCLAIHLKSRKIINIENMLMGRRYNSKNTKLEKGICQLEIPKPFLEDEIGTWKIVSRRDGNEVEHGCFFNVGSDGSEELNELRNRVAIKQEIFAEWKSITIKCEEAPYPLKYCYLLSPDLELISNDDDIFQYTSTVGTCIFHNVRLPLYPYSNWKCGFNAHDESEKDILQDIEVKGANYFANIFHGKSVIRKKNENNPAFLCQSPLGIPIRTCMFISPDREFFHLSSSISQTRDYKYFGNGFEHGDCGIEFLNYSELSIPVGAWKCHISVDPRAEIQHINSFKKEFYIQRDSFKH